MDNSTSAQGARPLRLCDVVPRRFLDAVRVYGSLPCTPAQWSARTREENAAFLLHHMLYERANDARLLGEIMHLAGGVGEQMERLKREALRGQHRAEAER